MVKRTRRGLYTISSGSSHYWTSPGWIGELDRSTVEYILRQLRGARLRSWLWQVRFDHEALARALLSFGVRYTRFPIYILDLESDYERVFARYDSTIRNEVRHAARRGILVRSTSDASDILSYQVIYNNCQRDKERPVVFPARISMDLVKLDGLACFNIAEYEGAVIGGLLCLRDGNSVCALHMAHDRKYNHLFPSVALYDAAIQWACRTGADFFNFSHCGSAAPGQPLHVNQTLAQFKSFWGTRIEENWNFGHENAITNTIWERLSRAKSKMLRRRNESRRPDPSRETHNGLENDIQPVSELTWTQSAQLGELPAVCYRRASKSKNTMAHGASSWAAAKALGFLRTNGNKVTVLDFGCGNGRMIRRLCRKGCSIIGLDITFEMLKQAKYYGVPQHSCLAQCDGLLLPIKTESIDLVWSCGVLKYALFPPGSPCWGCAAPEAADKPFRPTYAEIAKEIHRALKPGGVVADYEMWIDESPELFIPAFVQVGFALERMAVIRRPYDRLEKLCDGRFSNRLGQWLVFRLANLSALLRYHFDDPRHGGDFIDYLFVWRKSSEQA
jgi:SAM-dependent methyltransferase